MGEIASLERKGPRARWELARLMLRGDWRTRALAVSAAGALVREDPSAWRATSILGRLLARVPGLRRHLPTTGHRGLLLSRSIANALVDRCMIVRTAAALALGECRDESLAPLLTPALNDPFRPTRLAAAVALVASHGQGAAPNVPSPLDRLADGADPTPELIGDGVSTLAWLTHLATRHAGLFAGLAARGGGMAGDTPGARAAWLAGPLRPAEPGGGEAEVARYEAEADLAFQIQKPFGAEDRSENLRLLNAFVGAAAHLGVPPGALVLDLGGGSGWVSELLLRYGLRPVTLDLSPSLLRLAARRLREATATARLVRGDMTALPFGDASFDAVIVVDALHHVDSMGIVVREVHRVLRTGGRFVVAEPGEGHSEAEKSRAEVREHGVREGEVHPFAMERWAKDAGFDRMRIVPRLPLGPTLTPDGLRQAMRSPVDRWQVEDVDGPTGFDSLALQSILDHPVLVLSKGERLSDSRHPSRLRAEIVARLERRHDRLVGEATLRNTGDTLWLAEATHASGQVRLGLQLLTAEGKMADRDFARVDLPRDMAPGEALVVSLDLAAPTGLAELKLDLVAEHVAWFEDRGSRPLHVRV